MLALAVHNELCSEERLPIFRKLHRLAAGIEELSRKKGFVCAKGFAGGSCKELFCNDHTDCPALRRIENCRYPQYARPSMSGFGIDVARLLDAAGWKMNLAAPAENKKADICGLVLVF